VNICDTCGKPVDHIARNGGKLFCNKKCFGISRRKNKTKAQKVAEKRLYDMAYRARNLSIIKARKKAYFRRTYDPKKAAKERKKKMPRHVEYCRQSWYKEWKSKYDQEYRAKKYFGAFWESAILCMQLDKEILSRMSRYEIGAANGTINKSLKRKRAYEASRSTSLIRC
jgi:hypothetical protein